MQLIRLLELDRIPGALASIGCLLEGLLLDLLAAPADPAPMALFFYRLLLLLALPVVAGRLIWRGREAPAYKLRRAERFGSVPADVAAHARGGVWIHAVSAGETIAIAPVILRLLDEFPQLPVLVTTMTPTGSEQVQRLLGGKVAHCYAPYDFDFAVDRFLAAVQPKLALFVETELWPVWLRRLERMGTPAMLINARLSEKSMQGYQKVSALTRPMLDRLTLIACQYPAHARRFEALGVSKERIRTLGSVKFDLELPQDLQARLDRWRIELGLADRPVWLAASTHAGEDEIVLAAHKRVLQVQADAVLIVVPRHPERFEAVAALAGPEARRLSRSDDAADRVTTNVIVGDTMGDVSALLGLSSIAFIGGSLVPSGGHNPVEAAIHGQSIVMGPHRFNFEQVCESFARAGCLHLVEGADGIAGQVLRCFRSEEHRNEQAQLARQVVEDNRGATAALIEILRPEITRIAAQ